ncbi:MAG: ArnT family glycosyltransferase [Thermoflexales bacterium]
MRLKTAVLSIVTLSAAVSGATYVLLIAPAPPLNFDEAAHSLPGYYVLRDLLALDMRALWGDFHIQTLWPPGFSLLQAPFLAMLGRSDESARAFALIMLVCAALMSFVLAGQIKRSTAAVAGWVSALIALSAPGWLFVGSWAMQETPVAFVVFASFAAVLRAWRTAQLAWYLLSGLSLYFLFLTKYNYAAFAVAAVGMVDLLRRVQQRRVQRSALLWQRHALELAALYVPLIAGVVFWFFGGTDIVPTEVKWRDFRFFVTNEDSGYPFWSAENLLFYVRVMLEWLMPSPFLAIAAVLGAVWAVVRLRHAGVWLLAVFFSLGFVLATVHQLKAPRYITPLFPSLWLLCGLGTADLLWLAKVRLRQQRAARDALIPGALGLCFLGALWSWVTWLPRLEPVWAGNAAADLRSAAQQIVQWQRGDRPVLIIGTFGELSPPLFEWRLRPLPAFANTPHPIQYDAPPVEGENDLARVQRWLAMHPTAQVTVIRVDESSPLYQTQDMHQKNAWRQALARQFESVASHRLVHARDYPRSGIHIAYYLPAEGQR